MRSRLWKFAGKVYSVLMAGDLSEKIKVIRNSLGLNQVEFAEKLNVGQSTVARWENGAVPRGEKLQQIADLANTTVERLFGVSELIAASQHDIPIVGYVGAGAEVLPFDDYAKGHGMEYIERPPSVTGDVVALEIKGDSMYPTAENGWKLVYAGEQTVLEDDVLNRLCVVKLADGRMLIKRIARGSIPGRYHLISSNTPIIENAEIAWAARVKAIIPN